MVPHEHLTTAFELPGFRVTARYDGTEIMNGVREVPAYGTAVQIGPAAK